MQSRCASSSTQLPWCLASLAAPSKGEKPRCGNWPLLCWAPWRDYHINDIVIHRTARTGEAPLSFPAPLGWDTAVKGLEDNPSVGSGVSMVLWEGCAEREWWWSRRKGMFRSVFERSMGGPKCDLFLQRSRTMSSMDQRYIAEIMPSPHHKSIKCCQHAHFIDCVDLRAQLTYHNALARKM